MRTWTPPRSCGSTRSASSTCPPVICSNRWRSALTSCSSSSAALVATASVMPARRLYSRRNSRAMSRDRFEPAPAQHEPEQVPDLRQHLLVREQRAEGRVPRVEGQLRVLEPAQHLGVAQRRGDAVELAEPLIDRGVTLRDLEGRLGIAPRGRRTGSSHRLSRFSSCCAKGCRAARCRPGCCPSRRGTPRPGGARADRSSSRRRRARRRRGRARPPGRAPH